MPELPGVGVLQDGIVEQDPLDDRYRIRIVEGDTQRILDIQDLLAPYVGQAVRVTVASHAGLQKTQEEVQRTLASEEN